MRLSSYIPFFFLLGTLVLAAPAEPASNLMPSVPGKNKVRNEGGGGGGTPTWKRAFGDVLDVGQPLF
jgi:hypothetical protein